MLLCAAIDFGKELAHGTTFQPSHKLVLKTPCFCASRDVATFLDGL